jgi:nitrate reductase gamma subunit
MRWRTKPVLTVFTTVFHLGVILIPIFLLAHVVLWEQYMGVTWITLPEGLADVLAVLTLAGCGYFAYRRIFDKQVAFVTRGEDWLILAIVTGTFLFGFLAGQQWGPYMAWLNLHVLFGEAFLIMIPFTRVKHMLLYPLTRGYIGSEFGAVRKTRDY